RPGRSLPPLSSPRRSLRPAPRHRARSFPSLPARCHGRRGSVETRQVRRESRAGRLRWASASRVILRHRSGTAAHRESSHATVAELSRIVPRAPAAGARAVSPRSERQADAVAFLIERDVIHQVANDEQPPPVFAFEVVRMRGIGKSCGIEAVAVVDDVDADSIALEFYLDTDDALGILARSVANGVPEGLGECGAKIEADAAGRERSGRKMAGNQLDRVTHHPEIARDVELHRILRKRALETQNAASASSAVRVIANNVSNLVSSNRVCRSALSPASRSSPPCSRIFFESETRTPNPEESMYPVLLKSMTNLREPSSSASRT